MKKQTKIILIALPFLLNIAITSGIYRFKHPELSETQLAAHIPKSFIYNFK